MFGRFDTVCMVWRTDGRTDNIGKCDVCTVARRKTRDKFKQFFITILCLFGNVSEHYSWSRCRHLIQLSSCKVSVEIMAQKKLVNPVYRSWQAQLLSGAYISHESHLVRDSNVNTEMRYIVDTVDIAALYTGETQALQMLLAVKNLLQLTIPVGVTNSMWRRAVLIRNI